jgi:hypothetical protein
MNFLLIYSQPFFSLKSDFFLKSMIYHVNEIQFFCVTPIKSMDEQPRPLFIIFKNGFFHFFAWSIFNLGFLLETTIKSFFTTIIF